MEKEINPEQGTLDLQKLIDVLDQRGLLVLQILLGQRAITVLEAQDKAKQEAKSNIIKRNPLVL